jgi:NitT/TauT family transport system substrate-binding protein
MPLLNVVIIRVARFLVLLTSVFFASLTTSAADEVIRVGNLKLAHFGAVSYASQISSSKCGIQVQERTFAKGLDVMQAIIAGEIDVGATASEAAISGRASGVPILIVAGFATGGARLLVRNDLTGIQKLADLKGKKVSVTRGSIQEILLGAELGQAGLSFSDQPGKDVQITYLSYPDLNQALLTKNVDVIMQSEPYASQALDRGFATEMLKPYDTPIGSPVRTLVMTEKFYNEKPELAKKYMTCFVQATHEFISDSKLASKFVRETLFKGQLSEKEFADAIANAPYGYDITPQHIQITIDQMVKYGIGKMAKPPVAKDFVTTELLQSAKKAVGIK